VAHMIRLKRKAPARRQGFSGGPGKAEGEMPGSASGHIAAVGRPFHVERGDRASKPGTGGAGYAGADGSRARQSLRKGDVGTTAGRGFGPCRD
jgi:hypothetical protein